MTCGGDVVILGGGVPAAGNGLFGGFGDGSKVGNVPRAGGVFDGGEGGPALGVAAVDCCFVPVFAVGFDPVCWDGADEAAESVVSEYVERSAIFRDRTGGVTFDGWLCGGERVYRDAVGGNIASVRVRKRKK